MRRMYEPHVRCRGRIPTANTADITSTGAIVVYFIDGPPLVGYK